MKVPLKVGNAIISAKVIQQGEPWPTMINVHDDENTSVVAGKIVIEQSGGRLIELSHGGNRLVTFELNGGRYRFDPNRIFSDAGIRATLEKQSTYCDSAHRAARQFAAEFLGHFGLDQESVIIALHNNTEGTLSIHSYNLGVDHAATVAKVHVAANRSPDDFVYVTDQRLFNCLQKRAFNVVLQESASVSDDGLLSVYFARKGIPCVNIEAELNHLNAQLEMVRAAREMVGEIIVVQPPSGS